MKKLILTVVVITICIASIVNEVIRKKKISA